MTSAEWNQLHALLRKYIEELNTPCHYPSKQWRELFTELNCAVARSIRRALKTDRYSLDK